MWATLSAAVEELTRPTYSEICFGLFPAGAMMVGALVVLLVVRALRAPRGARFDWTILLATTAYVPLFFIWARTTQLLPAVVAPSVLVLLADVRALGARRPAWTRAPALREIAVAVFLYVAGVTCFDAWARPFAQSWLGFGIGYVNPVVEAEYLARHPGRVFTRDQLLDAVWRDTHYVTPRSVDVYVRRIREKIEENPDDPRYLKTVRGAGYRFEIPKS